MACLKLARRYMYLREIKINEKLKSFCGHLFVTQTGLSVLIMHKIVEIFRGIQSFSKNLKHFTSTWQY